VAYLCPDKQKTADFKGFADKPYESAVLSNNIHKKDKYKQIIASKDPSPG
jgi:hypothetical protein